MTPLQVIQSLWPFGGPPERRTESQIDADLDEEFAFHLEMRSRENIETGCDPDLARSRAMTSFGSIESIKRQCRRIALEERLMLQRINLVVMLMVLVVVMLVGVQVFLTQRHNTLALQAITAELTDLKFQAQTEERLRQAATSPGMVYIDGDIARKGAFALPAGPALTLRRLIASAGGVADNDDANVIITRTHDGGAWSERITVDTLVTNTVDPVLEPGDHVVVERVHKLAQADVNISGGPAASVIIEGDVTGVGWQSIDMNTGTNLKQMLQRLNVRPEQWVRYRRTGQPGPTLTRDGSISGIAFLPAKDHLAMEESPLLRPNDEILVRDEPPLADRRTYFSRLLRDIAPTYWTATAEDGRVFHLAYETLGVRSIRVTLVEHSGPNFYVGGITAQGIHLRAESQSIRADWDMTNDSLVVDFRNARDSRTEAKIDDMPKELAGLMLTFSQTNDSTSFQKARENAGIAGAIERSVIELFGMSAQVDWGAANIDELLQGLIQHGERRAVENEADEAIAELVRAFYRERLVRLEAERRLREATDAQAKSEVLREFLVRLLVDAHPAESQVTITQVLNSAAARASEVFRYDERAMTAVRTAIADALRKVQKQPASPE